MAIGRERMARLRENRLLQGIRQVAVWLDQASVDRLVALRRPGEHDSDVVRRALEALERGGQPRDPVTTDVTTDTIGPVPRPVTRPATAPTDAPLLALLRQTTPPLPYAAIAAQLGISESQVKHKATAWTKEGLLAPRPRGGARPRRARHDPP
jgi:hypothetical protein